MISKLSKEEALSNLIGLGITFVGKRPDFKKIPTTPEQAIIQSLPYAKEDFLILQLLHSWINRNHDLIYAENFSKLIQTIPNKIDVAIMGGILTYTKDKRFSSILHKIKRITPNQNLEIEKSLSFAAKIGQYPFDPVMSKFGVMITELTLEAGNKKILPRERIASYNPFIKCRMLFGSNARADVAALMMLELRTPSEIKAVLNCSYETAHRNFGYLSEANWPNIILNDTKPVKLIS